MPKTPTITAFQIMKWRAGIWVKQSDREEYEEEEAEIAPAVIDEDGEISIPPDLEEPEIGPYYGDPDEEPEYNLELPDEELTADISTEEHFPDATGRIGDPKYLGHTFND